MPENYVFLLVLIKVDQKDITLSRLCYCIYIYIYIQIVKKYARDTLIPAIFKKMRHFGPTRSFNRRVHKSVETKVQVKEFSFPLIRPNVQ